MKSRPVGPHSLYFSCNSLTGAIMNDINLLETDIPGSASLEGRNPASLNVDELRFWLRCRGDSLKGLGLGK